MYRMVGQHAHGDVPVGWSRRGRKPHTHALDLLLARLADAKLSQARAAEMVNTQARRIGRTGPSFSAMQMNHILRRQRLPTLEIAVAIDRAFGVPPHAWFQQGTKR